MSKPRPRKFIHIDDITHAKLKAYAHENEITIEQLVSMVLVDFMERVVEVPILCNVCKNNVVETEDQTCIECNKALREEWKQWNG